MASQSTLPPQDYIATSYDGSEDKETWEKHADKYDEMIGNVTLQAADALIDILESETDLKDRYASAGGDGVVQIIELGSGTGSLAVRLLARYPDIDLLATDSSPGMLAQLKRKLNKQPVQSTQSAQQEQGEKSSNLPPTTTTTEAQAHQPNDQPANPVPQPNTKPQNLRTAVLDMTNPPTPSSTFTYVLSICALQSTPSCQLATQTAYQLTSPSGWCALGIWDFTGACAPHDVWRRAVRRVDPEYVEPRIVPEPQWLGREELVEGMREVGFRGVVEGMVRCRMVDAGGAGAGEAGDGTEAFMRWFWRSGNPMPANRLSSFHGDREALKRAMRDVLNEEYDRGRNLYIDVCFAVGRKSSGEV